MHNPTRRVKRFKQPLAPVRQFNQLSQTSPYHSHVVPGQESLTSSGVNYVRHRQSDQRDTLRGAMLVALVVVTVVLYFVLWELERSSSVLVPKRNLLSTGSSEAASTRYPPMVVIHQQNGAVFSPGGTSNLSDDRVVAASSILAGQDDDHTLEDEISELASFDAAYCDGACRFLLPIRIGEQESKARIHFMQLLVLAKRLNRTIVLPNVGKSRMSACSEWSFDAYYDTSGFTYGGDRPGSSLAINLKEFAKWVDERPSPPDGFVISMGSKHQEPEDVPFMVEKTDVDQKFLSCLGSKLARLRTSLPATALSISFDSASLKKNLDGSTRLVHLLSNSLDMNSASDFDLMMEPGESIYQYTPQYANSSHLSLADVDVLVLDYDLRYPLFAASETVLTNFNLHYAPVLYDLADRLSENLGPFLGVHWRMETVPVQNLAWCAASLVSTLHTLLQNDATAKNVRHVWLATDYPHSLSSSMDDDPIMSDLRVGNNKGSSARNHGPLRKSSTFKASSLEHDDAIGILIEAFQPGGDLEAWQLTDLAEQLRRYPYVEGRFELNDTLLDDSGVFGILDKLVIVQASVFISGSKDCSKTSSFSKQVIEARQESLDAERGKGAIRNVVEYFGK